MAKNNNDVQSKRSNVLLKSIGNTTKAVFKTVAPNATNSITSLSYTKTLTSEIFGGIRKSASVLPDVKSKEGRQKANKIFMQATKDIATGNFTMENIGSRFTGTSAEVAGMFDMDDMYSMDAGDNEEFDFGAEATMQGSAGVARSVMEGTSATIEGLSNATEIISNVTLKSNQALSVSLITALNENTAALTAPLISIDENIMALGEKIDALIEFNNTNVLEYYDKSLVILDNMASAFENFEKYQMGQETREGRRIDNSSGFNLQNYATHIKEGIKDNSILQLLMMAGGSGKHMLANFIPKSIRKKIQTVDDMIPFYLDKMFEVVYDKLNSSDIGQLLGLGEVFGHQRRALTGLNMGNYMKDAMGWNGIAQKALVEVIPNYLARIESALTKKQASYFDYDEGIFKTRNQVLKEMKDEDDNTIAMGTSEMIGQFNAILSGYNLDHETSKRAQKKLSAIMNDVLAGKTNTRDMAARITNIMLEIGVESPDIKRFIPVADKGLDNTVREINELNARRSSTNNVASNILSRSDLSRRFLDKSFANNRYKHNFSGEKDVNAYIRTWQRSNEKTAIDLTEDPATVSELTSIIFLEGNSAEEKAEAALKANALLNKRYEIVSKTDKAGAFMSRMARKGYNKIRGISEEDEAINADIRLERAQYFDNMAQGAMDQVVSGLTRMVYGNTEDRAMEFDDDDLLGNGPGSNYYSQKNSRWKNIQLGNFPNGQVSTMGDAGCGPTALAAVRNQLFGYGISPASMGKFAMNNGFISQGGANRGLFTAGANKLGLDSKELGNSGQLFQSLINGKPAIIAGTSRGSKDPFTKSGHIVVANGADGYGNTSIMDPITGESKRYNINDLSKGMHGAYSYSLGYGPNDSSKSDTNNLVQDAKKLLKPSFKTQLGYDSQKISQSQNRVDDLAKTALKYGEGMDTRDSLSVTMSLMWKSVQNFGSSLLGKDGILTKYIPNTLKTIGQRLFTGDKAIFGKQYQKAKQFGSDIWSTAKSEMKSGYSNVYKNTMMYIFGDDFEKNPDYQNSKILSGMLNPNKDGSGTGPSSASGNFIKLALPKAIAAGIAGAGVGLLNSQSSLLGSMFLPGGPIAGAIVGSSLAILSQTETFKTFMFGKLDPETMQRTGGLVTGEMAAKFKKAMPAMVGGAVLGGLKSLVGGALGFNSGLGVLGMQILPGGILGGALMGMGFSLLKNSETFKNMLFGKMDEDGNRDTNSNPIARMFKSSKDIFAQYMPAVKGGITGAGMGALLGLALKSGGYLPAMLSMGGPVGMGVLGLGLGIASSGTKFNKWLFGDKEEEGDSGFLGKVTGTLQDKFFGPLSDEFQYQLLRLTHWTKNEIMRPFQNVIGPVMDSMGRLKDDILNIVKNGLATLTGGLMNMFSTLFKSLFSPLLGIAKKVGSSALGAARFGVQAAMTPVAMGLQGLELLTSGKRKKDLKGFRSAWNDGSTREDALEMEWALREQQSGRKVSALEKTGDRLMSRVGMGNAARIAKSAFMSGSVANRRGLTDATGEDMSSAKWATSQIGKITDTNRMNKATREYKILKEVDKTRNTYTKTYPNNLQRANQSAIRKMMQKFINIGVPSELMQSVEDLKLALYNRSAFNGKIKEYFASQSTENPEVNKAYGSIYSKMFSKAYGQDINYNFDQSGNTTAGDTASETPEEKQVSILETIAEKISVTNQLLGSDVTTDVLGNAATSNDLSTIVEAAKTGKLGNTIQRMRYRKKKYIKEQQETIDARDGIENNEAIESEKAQKKGMFASISEYISSVFSDFNSNNEGSSTFDTISKFVLPGIMAMGALPLLTPSISEGIGEFVKSLPSTLAALITGDTGSSVVSGLATGGELVAKSASLGRLSGDSAISKIMGKLTGGAGGSIIGGIGGFAKGTAKAASRLLNPLNLLNPTAYLKGIGNIASSTIGGIASGAGKGSSVFDYASGTKTNSTLSKLTSLFTGNKSTSAATDVAESIVDDNLLKAVTSNSTSTVVDTAAKNTVTEVIEGTTKSIDKIIKSKLVTNALEALSSTKGGAILTQAIQTAVATATKLFKSLDSKLLAKIAEYAVGRMASITGKSLLTAATGGLALLFTVPAGALFGFMDGGGTANLFGVPEDMVDALMRTIHSLFEAIAASGTGALLELMLIIMEMATGTNYMRTMAEWLYTAFSGDITKATATLNTAQENLDLQRQIYNRENNTDYTIQEFNDKVNQGMVMGLVQSDIDTSSAQAQANAIQSSMGITTTGTTSTTTSTSQQIVNNLYSNGFVGNGKGALGYGKVTPGQVGEMAAQNGYISAGGANAGLMTHGANQLGLSYSKITDTNGLIQSLIMGKPVILSGKSSGGNNPFTAAGHIVVAKGIDNAGNVTIMDPNTGTEKSYRLSDIKSKLTSAWSYSKASGYGLSSDTLSQMSSIVSGQYSSLMGNITNRTSQVANLNSSLSEQYNKLISSNPNVSIGNGRGMKLSHISDSHIKRTSYSKPLGRGTADSNSDEKLEMILSILSEWFLYTKNRDDTNSSSSVTLNNINGGAITTPTSRSKSSQVSTSKYQERLTKMHKSMATKSLIK